MTDNQFQFYHDAKNLTNCASYCIIYYKICTNDSKMNTLTTRSFFIKPTYVDGFITYQDIFVHCKYVRNIIFCNNLLYVCTYNNSVYQLIQFNVDIKVISTKITIWLSNSAI